MQVTDWFCGKLHYEFDPAVHGTASEWLSDLVSISFTEPPAHFKRSMRTLKVSVEGPDMECVDGHQYIMQFLQQ